MAKKVSQSKDKPMTKVPEGIMVLAGICFVLALFLILYATTFFTLADVVRMTPPAELIAQGIDVTQSFAALVGLGSVFLALVFYFLGRGLLRFDNRSRVAMMLIIGALLVSVILMSIRDKVFLVYSTVYIFVVGGIIIRYLTSTQIQRLFK